MANKLQKQKEPTDLAAKQKQRRHGIALARDMYEAAAFHEQKLDKMLAWYIQEKAQAAFNQGRFAEAARLATDKQKKKEFAAFAKAYERLNAPMCKCSELDKETGEIAQPKVDLGFSYITDENKAVFFVGCAACNGIYAVSVDEKEPVNRQVETSYSDKKRKRRIDAKREREKVLQLVR